MQTHRNAPCPCGSGLKFKRCCAGKPTVAEAAASSNSAPLIALVVVVVLGGLAFAFFQGRSEEPATTFEMPGSPTSADGRVWSAEHGHWHDAQGREIPGGGMPTQAQMPMPAPVTAPPASADGRVWSAEHGHWHDAQGREIPGGGGPPPGQSAGATPPTGGAPGQVWSAEHGHWHDPE